MQAVVVGPDRRRRASGLYDLLNGATTPASVLRLLYFLYLPDVFRFRELPPGHCAGRPRADPARGGAAEHHLSSCHGDHDPPVAEMVSPLVRATASCFCHPAAAGGRDALRLRPAAE